MEEKVIIKDENQKFYDSDVAKKFELTKEMIQESQRIVDSDKDTIPKFWKEKYINESVKNWDKFYKRNNINFFLDRHWIEKEFEELIHSGNRANNNELLIEFGCGVGNSILPLLQISASLHFIGFDCSVRAVNLFEERWNKLLLSLGEHGTEVPEICKNYSSCLDNEKLNCQYLNGPLCPFNYCSNTINNKFDKNPINCENTNDESKNTFICKNNTKCNRLRTFVFDIVQGEIPDYICYPNMANYGLLIFVLSAIHPKYHQDVVNRCSKVLKPGAILLFRDYGRYDLAQLRFAKSSKSKIADNFYVRNDGTFAYYFTTDEIKTLFENAGFKVISNNYCLREVTNRKTNVSMKRVWIQSKFSKI
ncbi:conserved methylase [Cryptosporidium xiaoi]|uniref:tRNA N(3)-methylcytidine methyltransferase n=1 Tax=Cryptosporidium xiaoi TaxID=659607 RepID=A0AAV9Y1U7_9CRYT